MQNKSCTKILLFIVGDRDGNEISQTKNNTNIILNFIGSLYKDFIVYIDNDFVKYTIKDGYFVYKHRIPINITIGRYKFLKEKDFHNLFNN